MKLIKIGILTVFLVSLFCARAFAKDSVLVIGTKVIAPFAIKDSNNNWSGISIELWREVAQELNLKFRFEERDLSGILKGVGDGTLDAGVAAISVTPDREKVLDFTHPFFNSGLGIATRPRGQTTTFTILKHLFSGELLRVMLLLGGSICAIGFLIWLLERKRNPQFGGGWKDGVGSGLWWSAVTLTTVGYGDKTPTTLLGRLLALFWMFAAIILVSSFTASITSSLTIQELESNIHGPEDLNRLAVVGTVANTTGEAYLRNHNINVKTYPTPIACLKDVAKGQVDAMVYDAPVMKYLCATQLGNSVTVLPTMFEKQYYAIALPPKSVMRKDINEVLLRDISGSNMQEVIHRYLGE